MYTKKSWVWFPSNKYDQLVLQAKLNVSRHTSMQLRISESGKLRLCFMSLVNIKRILKIINNKRVLQHWASTWWSQGLIEGWGNRVLDVQFVIHLWQIVNITWATQTSFAATWTFSKNNWSVYFAWGNIHADAFLWLAVFNKPLMRKKTWLSIVNTGSEFTFYFNMFPSEYNAFAHN